MSHVLQEPTRVVPFTEQLQNGEPHWKTKLGLRSIVCVLDIVGIGCIAWLLGSRVSINENPYIGYFVGGATAVWPLITVRVLLQICVMLVPDESSTLQIGLSFIWCLTYNLIFLLRRPPRPTHHGFAVAFDLILWMGLAVTGLLTLALVWSVAAFGSDSSYLSDPTSGYNNDYYGRYELVPNNTWVYNVTGVTGDNSGDYFFNSTSGEYEYYPPANLSAVVRDCAPYFDTCAEQDAYINALWHSKHQRQSTTTVALVAQWAATLFHFGLFVWACVETHKRNKKSKKSKAQDMAEKIIRDMQMRGLIQPTGPAAQPLLPPQQQTPMAHDPTTWREASVERGHSAHSHSHPEHVMTQDPTQAATGYYAPKGSNA